MSYIPKKWKNLPDKTTPILADDLNNIEQGIATNSVQIGDLQNLNTAAKDNLVDAINDVNNNYIFSTSEKVIGKWINNKPLYRKVIDFGALPNNTVKQVNHNISDIDIITRIYGIGYISGHIRSYPIPLMYKGADSNYNVEILVTKQYVEMTSNTDRSNVFAYVVLEYTKTSTSNDGGMGNEPTV